MTGIQLEWLIFLLFFLLLVVVVIAEVFWLIRCGWAAAGLSVAYVLITDLLTFGIATIIGFVAFGAMFMMAFGPAGTGPTGNVDVPMTIALIFGLSAPPILLIALKRLFLRLFKIKFGKAAWIYSVVVSVLILLTVLGLPPLVYYLITNLTKWN